MNQNLLDDVWSIRDLPVLVATVRLLDETGRPVQANQISTATGIAEAEVQRALTNLGREHLEVADWGSLVGKDWVAIAKTAAGLRAAGAWPSAEVAADRLIAALEEIIDNTVDGSPKQSRLKAARDALLAAGRDVLVEVAGAAITGRVPLS